MKKAVLLGAVLASAGMLATANAAWAQSDSQSGTQKQNKPKPHKVWTDDNIGASNSGVTVAAASNPSASAQPAASANQDAGSASAQNSGDGGANTGDKPHKGAPPVLTNPKSTEEADKMIAWENRDIDAQQEGLNKLRAQIAEAPLDQRDRLEKLYDQRAQILINTKNELKNLQEKKKTLENPPAQASAQPPQQ